MIDYHSLYEEAEKALVRFVGFTTGNARYDFGIVYSQMFFGKPIVICMQTNRSALLSMEDLDDLAYLRKTFSVSSDEETESLREILMTQLPLQQSHVQYE